MSTVTLNIDADAIRARLENPTIDLEDPATVRRGEKRVIEATMLLLAFGDGDAEMSAGFGPLISEVFGDPQATAEYVIGAGRVLAGVLSGFAELSGGTPQEFLQGMGALLAEQDHRDQT